MNNNIQYPTIEDIQKMTVVAENLFETSEDATQAEPTVENTSQLVAIDKNTLVCFKDNDTVIAWSVVLPTSKVNMNNFLSGKITEKQLSDESKKNHSFEALYLMAVITLPEYRRRGLSFQLVQYQIEYFKSVYGISDFYTMPFSFEGEQVLKKLVDGLHIPIKSSIVI